MNIYILPDGQVKFLGGTLYGLAGHATHKRVSHIEPTNYCLRVLFHLIRRWVADDGRMAAFTRRWKCRWRVNIINGPTWGEYLCRQSAIDAEREWLQEKGF